MESVAEEPPTVALASTEMPRFADGAASMQELLGQLAESIANETMGAEAEQPCGETGTGRNGCRGRKPIACVGTLDPRIPRTGRGASFPDDAPVRHQRVDRAPVPAVAEMHAAGTSARKVQRIAEKLGAGRPPEDQAGAMAQSLGEGLEDLRTRPPVGSQMPCIWPGATCMKCRREGHVASTAIVTAIGCGGRRPGIPGPPRIALEGARDQQRPGEVEQGDQAQVQSRAGLPVREAAGKARGGRHGRAGRGVGRIALLLGAEDGRALRSQPIPGAGHPGGAGEGGRDGKEGDGGRPRACRQDGGSLR